MWPFRRRRKLPLGRLGEKLTRRFCRRSGLKILACNYRCPVGEADLVVLDASTRRQGGAETIAFVEVKTRRSDRYTDPQAAVNADKRRKMRKVADYYLATHDAEGFNVRFDIAAVVIRDGGEGEINYIPGAF